MSLVLRVLVGFALACIAAGLTTVLFAWSPAELAGMPGDPMEKVALTFPLATHAAIFSAPFALIAIALGEWQRWRDWAYYSAAGMVISMIGFFAQYQSEQANQSWSIVSSNYPLIAFLAAGLAAGLTYWLFSGRLVGVSSHDQSGHGQNHATATGSNARR
jgi:zinc transporter ZupT